MKIRFRVTGMTCAACSARVEKVSASVTGVRKSEVNLLKGTMMIEAEDAAVVASVIKAVEASGYGASLYNADPKEHLPAEQSLKKMEKQLVGSVFLLIILMYFTMGHMVGLPVPSWYHGSENAVVAALVQLTLTMPVVYLNRSYYTRGLKALLHKAPNMDSLIAVGSLAALIYGIAALYRMSWGLGHGRWDVVELYSENLYFESAAMILTLITVGKYLETRAKGKTGDAIRQLMDLSPKSAIILRDGNEYEIPVEQVVVGDTIIVRSGGRIPVDGTVLEGRGAVDQSALTGESVPIEKKPGDSVAAATINTEGYFLLRADKVGEDTTLSQVIRMVEEAGGSKAPIARLADKISSVFVPVVMIAALITFSVWMLAGKGLEFSLSVGIAVLVISCPCALGLATPVAIMVGTGRGAAIGVLFKNAESLENLHKVDTIVLDKTGTLTSGQPAVTDIFPVGITQDQLLAIAAAVEAKSEHLFAKAIMNRAKGISYSEASYFETIPGKGVCATVDGIQYYGGNHRLMEEIGVVTPSFTELTQHGKTPLFFATSDKTYLGAIAAADVLKEDSGSAIAAMQRLGMNVIMLTGDNRNTAMTIAQKAGIEHVIADVLPGDKAGVVQKLRSEGHRVLMVGDGINDAPALVSADVGMSIGTGTDIAIESADIVLMSSSLSSVCSAIELSKATIKNIKENLFWAFFYNSLGIPVAAGILYPSFGILLNPMLAAAAMSLSSFFVVSNALRLRLFKPKTIKHPNPTIIKTEINEEEASMETIIHVEGMMCSHCKARVESVCKAVPGTLEAVVDLKLKCVTVTGTAAVDELKKAITDAGYEVVEE